MKKQKQGFTQVRVVRLYDIKYIGIRWNRLGFC
jgi:hypothetical protein